MSSPPIPSLVSILLPVAVERPYTYRSERPLAPGTIVAVPLGPREIIGVVVADAPENVPAAKLRDILLAFDVPPLSRELLAFVDWLADYTLTPRGMVMRMVLRSPDALSPPDPTTTVALGEARPARLTPARVKAIEVAATAETWTRARLAKAAGVSTAVIAGLVRDGTLIERLSHIPRIWPRLDPSFATPNLTADQRAAADALRSLVDAKAFAVPLLDGVTGAGKTEVFFEAIAATLGAGHQALVLMPEIALTAAVRDRFTARFGGRPAEWHSELGPRIRSAVWRGVASGEARVVVGARSALFLPFADLRLIVVDEEHDASYKQEEGVTYHARDMAVVRARIGGFPVILSSATPSLETVVNAEAGRYRRLTLPSRFGGEAEPRIAAIDMRRDGPERGRFISPPLVAAIGETLARGEQALLFLNRRGFAPLTLCRVCGHRLGCPNCSAWLVEHRFRKALACHHCGYQQPLPDTCPHCRSTASFVPCGPGVERLEAEVVERFPSARTLVLSSDLGVERLRQEIAAIVAGEADIVVGTQLVAKGHNFPHVTLVGIVDGDLGLDAADPRAGERTFQLLTQVAGRAGRTGRPSRGLLQSYQPEHPVIQAIVGADRERFYAEEIAVRRRGGLPPFGRLASVLVTAAGRHEAEAHARALAEAAPSSPAIRLLGPAEAPLAMVRGRYRWRLLARAGDAHSLHDWLRRWLAKAPTPRGSVKASIDIDPQSFL